MKICTLLFQSHRMLSSFDELTGQCPCPLVDDHFQIAKTIIRDNGVDEFAIHRFGHGSEAFKRYLAQRLTLLKSGDARLFDTYAVGKLSGAHPQCAPDGFDPTSSWSFVRPKRRPWADLLLHKAALAKETLSASFHVNMMTYKTSYVN